MRTFETRTTATNARVIVSINLNSAYNFDYDYYDWWRRENQIQRTEHLVGIDIYSENAI